VSEFVFANAGDRLMNIKMENQSFMRMGIN
jgi:hypothetical protein